MNIKSVCAALGPLYRIEDRDGVPSIVRRINDSLEFEVTGFFRCSSLTVNLWLMSPHIELLAIYSGIATESNLPGRCRASGSMSSPSEMETPTSILGNGPLTSSSQVAC